MLWIGITGPMGSGKSTVAHLLRQMGFEVLDADKVAHKVLGAGTPGEAEVFRTFGEEFRESPGGKLDRRALGRAVFGDGAKLAKLESIIHPLIQKEIGEQRQSLANLGHQAAFYDVPLLFEKNKQNEFDHIFVTKAGLELRKERVMVRSQLTEAEIVERNAKQIAPEIKEAAASAVIVNDGSLQDLRQAVIGALTKVGVRLPGVA